MTFLELAIKTLEKSEEPLTVDQIWDKSDEYGFREKLSSSGITPVKTLGARIYCEIRDNADSEIYIASKKPTKFSLKNKPKKEIIINDNSTTLLNYPDDLEKAINGYINHLNELKKNINSMKNQAEFLYKSLKQTYNEIDKIEEQYEEVNELVVKYYTKNEPERFEYLNATTKYLTEKHISSELSSLSAIKNVKENVTIEEKKIFQKAPNITISFNAILVYCNSFNYNLNEKNITPYNANILTFEYNKKQGQFNYKKGMFTKPVFYDKNLNVFFITAEVYKQIPSTVKVLCKTISEDSFVYFRKNQDYNNLRYKTYSQAILEQMDYNSDQLILQTQKRQGILKSAIDSKIIKTPDLINYLNWAIKNDKSNPTKIHFIKSWQNDLDYIINLNQNVSVQPKETKSITISVDEPNKHKVLYRNLNKHSTTIIVSDFYKSSYEYLILAGFCIYMNCHVSLVCCKKNDSLKFHDTQVTLNKLKLTLKDKEIQKTTGVVKDFYKTIKRTVYENIKDLSDNNYFKLSDYYLIQAPDKTQRDLVVVGITMKYVLDK